MKKQGIRNFVLSINKKQAFYDGREIVECGHTGTLNTYWLTLLDINGDIETITVKRPAQVLVRH